MCHWSAARPFSSFITLHCWVSWRAEGLFPLRPLLWRNPHKAIGCNALRQAVVRHLLQGDPALHLWCIGGVWCVPPVQVQVNGPYLYVAFPVFQPLKVLLKHNSAVTHSHTQFNRNSCTHQRRSHQEQFGSVSFPRTLKHVDRRSLGSNHQPSGW